MMPRATCASVPKSLPLSKLVLQPRTLPARNFQGQRHQGGQARGDQHHKREGHTLQPEDPGHVIPTNLLPHGLLEPLPIGLVHQAVLPLSPQLVLVELPELGVLDHGDAGVDVEGVLQLQGGQGVHVRLHVNSASDQDQIGIFLLRE